MKRFFFLVPILVFLGLAVVFWAGLNGGPPTYLPSELVGKSAPDITLPPLDEQAQGFDRSELASGKPIVVNFFASWCAPCRVEHPTLESLSKRPGVTVYGVDYKESLYGKSAKDARSFLNELGNPFTKINQDQEGRVSIDWGVTGVPETFVVDGNGVIRAHYPGPLTEDVLQRVILPALAAK